MRRILVLLFALACFPTFCLADSINSFDEYQINVRATWVATNPDCGFNCTETMSISYRFLVNTQPDPNGSARGWVDVSTLQESSSGFMGSFDFQHNYPASGFYEDDGFPSADGLPFYNVFNGTTDEIDLGFMGPGVAAGETYPDMFIWACRTYSCQNALTGVFPEDIRANTESSTAVKVPAGDSAWELLLVSAIVCTFSLFVKHQTNPEQYRCRLRGLSR